MIPFISRALLSFPPLRSIEVYLRFERRSRKALSDDDLICTETKGTVGRENQSFRELTKFNFQII